MNDGYTIDFTHLKNWRIKGNYISDGYGGQYTSDHDGYHRVAEVPGMYVHKLLNSIRKAIGHGRWTDLDTFTKGFNLANAAVLDDMMIAACEAITDKGDNYDT